MYRMCCLYIITGNLILCYIFFLLHPLHPCWNILDICETDKEPLNPTGFPAPFAPMIVHCCICTGINSSCWYDRDVYYTVFDGKQSSYFESESENMNPLYVHNKGSSEIHSKSMNSNAACTTSHKAWKRPQKCKLSTNEFHGKNCERQCTEALAVPVVMNACINATESSQTALYWARVSPLCHIHTVVRTLADAHKHAIPLPLFLQKMLCFPSWKNRMFKCGFWMFDSTAVIQSESIL